MTKHDRDMSVLENIAAYCGYIRDSMARFGDDYDIFAHDRDYQLSCSMSILQIGELCKRLTEDFRMEHGGIRWQKYGNVRNEFAHDYDNVEMEILWDTIKKDIPALAAYCGSVLAGHRMANYDVFVELEPAGPGEGGGILGACDDRDMTI